MKDIIITVVLAVLGSNGLFTFIQFLLDYFDKHKGSKFKLTKKIDQLEKDSCRTQLLLMISDYSGERQEIFKIAKHYFVDLNGDWYLTEIFRSWLARNDLQCPEWFINKH